jgi:hypothetical protein
VAKSNYTAKRDREFLAWIRTLPSCLSGESPCVAAHVRRVSEGAGMGIKPRLFSVPMTDIEHRYLHQHGEYAAYFYFYPLPGHYDLQGVKDWFSEQALKYREMFLAR